MRLLNQNEFKIKNTEITDKLVVQNKSSFKKPGLIINISNMNDDLIYKLFDILSKNKIPTLGIYGEDNKKNCIIYFKNKDYDKFKKDFQKKYNKDFIPKKMEIYLNINNYEINLNLIF